MRSPARGEFYTSYTPYQPEVSQGNLQVMFEYQTLICQLTGMDVSNASLYDGGSAAAEGVLLAMSVTGRPKKVVVAESVHPHYREILETYFASIGAELVTVAAPGRRRCSRPMWRRRSMARRPACSLQHPNFFGCLEDVAAIAKIAHDAGALLVQSFDPISLGLLKRPGDLGADVAVAEGQSLGTPLLYGGPYLGIMACKEQFVRRMPGRIAGQTVDRRGRRCWVLTLQTREQHIRREKATSNICTNQGLFALRAAIYLAEMGPQGLRETAELCLQKAHYAKQRLTAGSRLSLGLRSADVQGVRRPRSRRPRGRPACPGLRRRLPRRHPARPVVSAARRLLPRHRHREAHQSRNRRPGRSPRRPRRIGRAPAARPAGRRLRYNCSHEHDHA